MFLGGSRFIPAECAALAAQASLQGWISRSVGMFRYALRNLLQNKIRLVISVGGVALALTLILALDAIMTGVEGRLTAYIDNSGADVFVSQPGVRNLQMVSSSLPASVVDKVQAVPGVTAVTPIMYLTGTMEVGTNQD